MVMSCNEIASKLGSTHKCNQRKCMTRTSKNPITLYSTKDSQHHEFLTTLYEQMTRKVIELGLLLRSMIKDIENEFGHEFECCKNHRNLILKNINLCKKRKAEEELENAAQRQKISNCKEEKNDKDNGPTAVEEDGTQSEGYVTEDEELTIIMNSPASQSPLHQTTPSSITGSESSSPRLPQPLNFDCSQTTTSQINTNDRKQKMPSKSVFLGRFTQKK